MDIFSKAKKGKFIENIMRRNDQKNYYNLSIEDRITKARISCQRRSPFFSYLVMHLSFEENETLSGGTLGVDPAGNVYYNKDFMKKLTDEEILTAILHETCHVAFQTHDRKKGRDKLIFNIASDTWINNTLQNNGFKLIQGGITPGNNNVIIWGIPITNIDKKSTEEIYDELYNGISKQKGLKGKGKRQNEDGQRVDIDSGEYDFDKHIEENTKKTKEEKDKGKGKDFEKNTDKISKNNEKHGETSQKELPKEEENETSGEKWKRIVSEAATMAKMKGIIPNGIDRQVDELLHPQQNWEQILYKYITKEIAKDVDWSYPSRRSQAVGVYLPHTKKENIEMACWLDTSGSIDEDSLKTFLGIFQDVVNSFENIKMTIFACDSKIHGIFEIGQGKRDVLDEVKPKGGGGTDCNPVFKHLSENMPNIKLVICVTDGEIFNKPNLYNLRANIIWLIPEEGGSEEMVKGTGEILRFSW